MLNLFKEYKLTKRIDKCLEILDVNNYPYPDKELLLNEICEYIFETNKSSSGEKTFDLEQDYKFYFCDFFKAGINLNTDEISWWEFNALLEGFFLDEKSTISTVIGYRTYKKPPSNIKTQSSQQHKFYSAMKRKYALKSEDTTNNGLETLWNFLEKKVRNKEK